MINQENVTTIVLLQYIEIYIENKISIHYYNLNDFA